MTITVAEARPLYQDLATPTSTVGAFMFADGSEAALYDLAGRQIEIEADCTAEGPEPRDDEEPALRAFRPFRSRSTGQVVEGPDRESN